VYAEHAERRRMRASLDCVKAINVEGGDVLSSD